MSASNLRNGGFFVAGNLAAGLLNYLFQVVAARQLQPQDFADLNAWIAHVAVFSVTAGLAQYAANFFPSRRKLLRTTIWLVNAAALILLWRWSTQSGLSAERAALVVIITSFFGWLLGQAQIRLAFVAMVAGSLLFGAFKLTFAFIPFYPEGSVERFALGLYAGYIPALLALSYYLWRAPEPKRHESGSWAAPVVLSLTAVIIPQLDMVLMNHTQPPDAFEAFVKASLFYKSIYFWVYIGAQLLLPHQIQGRAGSTVKALSLAFTAALVGCVGLTVISPWISSWLLRWSTPPPPSLVFWSCVHMSLLTMLFLWIQEMCVSRRPWHAAAALLVLGLEAAAQVVFRWPASTYLALVTVVQLLLLFTAYWLSGHIGAKGRERVPAAQI